VEAGIVADQRPGLSIGARWTSAPRRRGPATASSG